ncbi:uncharacterized protein LOC100844398 isoform X3 [Brachypodium distachyon]|uniref:uncharacterized protein LOC100844398 isoform X3 n=1 Tax=Brachypodium distachyon TaxID=15368 RepID=UPI00071DDA38|nr:uncharacterized protein LOC100844398 isoform X3 [Brachypodium distachyon]|eukprot:XP_014752379.1 uncharacterized protein LOC100844398 isoform X3 [Brachypodium distachyon]
MPIFLTLPFVLSLQSLRPGRSASLWSAPRFPGCVLLSWGGDLACCWLWFRGEWFGACWTENCVLGVAFFVCAVGAGRRVRFRFRRGFRLFWWWLFVHCVRPRVVVCDLQPVVWAEQVVDGRFVAASLHWISVRPLHRLMRYCKCWMPCNPDDLMIQCEECTDCRWSRNEGGAEGALDEIYISCMRCGDVHCCFEFDVCRHGRTCNSLF